MQKQHDRGLQAVRSWQKSRRLVRFSSSKVCISIHVICHPLFVLIHVPSILRNVSVIVEPYKCQ